MDDLDNDLDKDIDKDNRNHYRIESFRFRNRILALPEKSRKETQRKKPRLRTYLARAGIYDIKITMGERDRFWIHEFVKASSVEIYLIMLVERKGQHFHLYKPLCFKQSGEEAKTKIDIKDEDRYIRELLDSNRPFEEIKEEILRMRCWVHSHPRLCWWWSFEDNQNCERFDNGDYFISVVVYATKDKLYYNCRLDLFEPKKEIREKLENIGIYHPGRLTLTDLEIEIIDDRGPDFNPEEIKKEVQKLAQEKVEIAKRKVREDKNENNKKGNKDFKEIRETRIRSLAAKISSKADCNHRPRSSWLYRCLRSFFSWFKRDNRL